MDPTFGPTAGRTRENGVTGSPAERLIRDLPLSYLETNAQEELRLRPVGISDLDRRRQLRRFLVGRPPERVGRQLLEQRQLPRRRRGQRHHARAGTAFQVWPREKWPLASRIPFTNCTSFRWGDGAAFKCESMALCFHDGSIVEANGTFKYARKVQTCLSIFNTELIFRHVPGYTTYVGAQDRCLEGFGLGRRLVPRNGDRRWG